MERQRISRMELHLMMAELISKRSTCPKKAVGAVLTRNNRVIATGYNGVPAYEPHSSGMDDKGITHTIHAETNIIAFCAKEGISTDGTTLYTTLSPCEKCAELLIQAGIKRVIYIEKYRDDSGIIKLLRNDVQISQMAINYEEYKHHDKPEISDTSIS